MSGFTRASLLLILIGCFLVLITTAPRIQHAQSCVPPPLGMVSWWTGDGNANDIQGSNNGTLNGAIFVAGKVGQAFSLDGNGGHISIGNPANLKLTNAITIDAWINPADAAEGGLTAVVTKWGQSSADDSYGLWITKQNGVIKLFGGVANNNAPYLTGGIITPNNFSHVALTFDSVTGAFAIYVNGQQVASAIASGSIHTSDRNVLIGREDSLLPRPFRGLIDEVSIYNRALTASEIQAIYNAGSAGKCKLVDTIGDPIIPRSTIDTGVGQMWAFNDFFPNPGEVVTSWSFFNAAPSTTGRLVTPLIMCRASPTTWAIIGIGTTRTNNAAGVQTFPFGLVAGTDVVGSNCTFGWKDGASVSSNGEGVVEYDSPATGPGYQYFEQGVDAVVGRTYSSNNLNTRNYSVQFTAKRVASSCVQTPSGMVSWWTGDGNTNDIKGGNNGTLQNGATFAPGLVGQAFQIQGGGYVSVAPNSSLDVTRFTVEAWIKPSSTGTEGFILDKGVVGAGNYFLSRVGDGRIYVDFYDGAHRSAGSTSTCAPDAWCHVAGTYDGATLKIYLNGVPEGTLSYIGTPPAQGQPLMIGQRNGGTLPFQGLIDEVSIFNRALTASEIQAIYNADSTGKCKPLFTTQVVIPKQTPSYKYQVFSFGGVPGSFGADNFDDSAFSVGDAAFGSGGGCTVQSTVRTSWPKSTEIVLRKSFTLPAGASNLKVLAAVDNDIQVLLNGVDISGGLVSHEGCASFDLLFNAPNALLRDGQNLLALRARDRGGETFVDIQVSADLPTTTQLTLTLNPSSVLGGQPSAGTVTLSGPAPTGGAVITLSSSDTTSAIVPPGITIPQGATSKTFTINTNVIASDTIVDISVSYGGVTKTASLTVTTLRPDLQISSGNAPTQTFTDSAFDLSWTDVNNGQGRANGPWTDKVYLSTDNQIGNDTLLTQFPFTGALDPSQSTPPRTQTISIPRSAIPTDGQYFLIVLTDADNNVTESDENNNWRAMPITVTSAPPVGITISPSDLQFGGVPITTSARRTVTITSTGLNPVTVNSINVAGTFFTLGKLPSLPLVLPPSGTVSFDVIFTPLGTISSSGTVTVNSNATTAAPPITLSGNGTPPALPPAAAITVTTDHPVYRRGQPVQISGKVTAADGAGISNIPVAVQVSLNGSVRTLNPYTDAQGTYRAIFQPTATDGGTFLITATGTSGGVTKQVNANFRIVGLLISPDTLSQDQVMGSDLTVPLDLLNVGDATLNNLNYSVVITPSGALTARLPQSASPLVPGGLVTIPVVLTAPSGNPPPMPVSVQVKVAVTDSVSGFVAQETSTLTIKLRPAVSTPVLIPSTLSVGVHPGKSITRRFVVRNDGYLPMNSATVTLQNPTAFNWISLGYANLGTIAPGDSREFQIMISPPADLALGNYTVFFNVNGGTNPLQGTVNISVTRSTLGTAVFVVNDDTGSKVGGATVTLFGKTTGKTFQGVTSGDGQASLGGVDAGEYSYVVAASSHEPGSGSVTVTADATASVPVLLSYDVVSLTFTVTPTTIVDQYNVTLNITYSTTLPKPALQVVPYSLDLSFFPEDVPDGRYPCSLSITNTHPTTSVRNVSVDASQLDVSQPNGQRVHIQFADGTTLYQIGTLAGKATTEVPCYATLDGVAVPTHKAGNIQVQANYDFSLDGQMLEGTTTTKVPVNYVRPDNLSYQPVPFIYDKKTDPANPILKYDAGSFVYTVRSNRNQILNLLKSAGPLFDGHNLVAFTETQPGSTSLDVINGNQANVFWRTNFSPLKQTLLGIGDTTTYDISTLDNGLTLAQALNAQIAINPEQVINKPTYLGFEGQWTGSAAPNGYLVPVKVTTITPNSITIPKPPQSSVVGCLNPEDPFCKDPEPQPQSLPAQEGQILIGIDQTIRLERQAFNASLGIGARTVLNNTVASINVRDANGNDASNKFFVLVTADPLGATHGGTVSGQTNVSWQLIPKADAGGTSPQGTQYRVQAGLSYVVNGTARNASTQAVTITVLPSPKLTVAYSAPFVVMTGKEAKVRVTVQNIGFGTARNLSIESMQPRIVQSIPENPIDFDSPGPLVDFNLTGSSNTANGTGFQEGNLTINFGDVPPGATVSGYWALQVSRKGFFIDISSTFSHRDFQGIQLDPLVLPPTTSLVPAIGGTVSSGSGPGIPGLTVTVSQAGVVKGSDPTDFSGVYYISDLTPGAYLEEVRDLSGTVLASKSITVPGDQATNFINFVIANYNPTEAIVVIKSDPPGLPFTADGITFNTPHSFTWAVGSTHTVGASTSAPSNQTLVGWSDGETSATRTITVEAFGGTFQPLYMPSDIVNQYTRTPVTIDATSNSRSSSVTNDATDHKWPAMNNHGDIVWSQKVNGHWQVFRKRSTGAPEQITSDEHNHERPVISDDGTIAWFQDSTGGGLGYAIVRLDHGSGSPSIVEFSSRSRSECNPLTGQCFTPQERAAGKTFGIDSDGRTISYYTFYEFGFPQYRRFNVSGIGKLPEGSASPGDFSGYESPDINHESRIVYGNSFVAGVTAKTRYIWLATTTQPLAQTLIGEGQYPHISDGTNPEIAYIKRGIEVTHWPGAGAGKWIDTGLWADVIGTGTAATIVYEKKVNGYSQIWLAKPSTTGTINVTTNQQAATFTVTGPATYSGSGTSFTQTNAPVGTYSITYGDVAGLVKPPIQTKTLSSGGTITFSVMYSSCSLSPSSRRKAFPALGGSSTLDVTTCSCSLSLSSRRKAFPALGGSSTLDVTTSDVACNWAATTFDSWITITSASIGVGNGTVRYSISANTDSSPRTGTISIAGEIFTVNQDGMCGTTIQDERNQIIAEYYPRAEGGIYQKGVVDTTTSQPFRPTCQDFTQSAHSMFFTFLDLNVDTEPNHPHYSWAIIRYPLIVPKDLKGLDRWAFLLKPKYGTRHINSAYRSPSHNVDIGSKTNNRSRHMFGDAVDMRNESCSVRCSRQEWDDMNIVAQGIADYVETLKELKGKIDHVHADWRRTQSRQGQMPLGNEKFKPSVGSWLSVFTSAITQPSASNSSDISVLLEQLRSTDPEVRMNAFYAIGEFGYSSSDEVKLAIINLLATENAYEEAQGDTAVNLPLDYGPYFGDVVDAVAALNDTRAMNALLGVVDRGRIATTALATMGPNVLDPLIAILTTGNQTKRAGAALALGQMLEPDNFTAISDPASINKFKQALTSAASDQSDYVKIVIVDDIKQLQRVTNAAPASVAINAASLSQVFDGTPKVVTTSTNPQGLSVAITYNGLTSAPSSVGSYAVEAIIIDPNFQGTASGMLTINLQTNRTCVGDLNRDGIVDNSDLAIVRSAFGSRCSTPEYRAVADANGDCIVDVNDLAIVSRDIGCRWTPPHFNISGRVADGAGTGISNVTLTLSGSRSATTQTDGSGAYSFSNLSTGNYTVTPSLIGFAFTPASLSFVNLGGDQTANFTGVQNTFSVGGRVTFGNVGLGGVTITLGGSQTRTITTDSGGNYLIPNLLTVGNYTITPSKTNYNFTPQNQTLNNPSGNQAAKFAAAVTPGVPILISEENSTRAIALDSVLWIQAPYQLNYSSLWGVDRRTRVTLFAMNFDLQPGENISSVNADAEDASHRIYPLTVEYVGKVAGFDWLRYVVIRLNDDMGNIGDVLVRINVHGFPSNRVRLGVGHNGGGPPDDTWAIPTPGRQP